MDDDMKFRLECVVFQICVIGMYCLSAAMLCEVIAAIRD